MNIDTLSKYTRVACTVSDPSVSIKNVFVLGVTNQQTHAEIKTFIGGLDGEQQNALKAFDPLNGDTYKNIDSSDGVVFNCIAYIDKIFVNLNDPPDLTASNYDNSFIANYVYVYAENTHGFIKIN